MDGIKIVCGWTEFYMDELSNEYISGLQNLAKELTAEVEFYHMPVKRRIMVCISENGSNEVKRDMLSKLLSVCTEYKCVIQLDPSNPTCALIKDMIRDEFPEVEVSQYPTGHWPDSTEMLIGGAYVMGAEMDLNICASNIIDSTESIVELFEQYQRLFQNDDDWDQFVIQLTNVDQYIERVWGQQSSKEQYEQYCHSITSEIQAYAKSKYMVTDAYVRIKEGGTMLEE